MSRAQRRRESAVRIATESLVKAAEQRESKGVMGAGGSKREGVMGYEIVALAHYIVTGERISAVRDIVDPPAVASPDPGPSDTTEQGVDR